MTKTAKILSSALRLPESERAELAKELVLSLEDDYEVHVRKEWEKEIRKRSDSVHRGRAKMSDAKEAIRRLRFFAAKDNSMRLRVLNEAEDELREAAQWYESRREGLGHAFLDQLQFGFDAVAAHPKRYPRHTNLAAREIRRFLLPSFPYAIVYEIIGKRTVVLAVAHAKRRPGYWKDRHV